MAEMLKPKDVTITTQEGVEKTYVISKIPAIPAREIVAKYPISAMPKLGDYAVNEATMLKLMSYVGVYSPNGVIIRLTTKELVDNHVPDWETLGKLEWSELEYNCSFFGNGLASTFLEGIAQKAQALISKILMDLSVQSSQRNKQP